jgi:hypothetical protein
MTRAIPLVLFLSVAPAAWGAGGHPCPGPTKLVEVTVEEEAKSPPTYVFAVRNLHKSPVAIFAMGNGDRYEMQSIPDNLPASFTSPKGWEGGTAFKDESKFMQIYWKTPEPASMVGAGRSLGGFKVVMPSRPAKRVPLFHVDGTPSEPLDLNKGPFRIYFEDGTCVWGRVREEK